MLGAILEAGPFHINHSARSYHSLDLNIYIYIGRSRKVDRERQLSVVRRAIIEMMLKSCNGKYHATGHP